MEIKKLYKDLKTSNCLDKDDTHKDASEIPIFDTPSYHNFLAVECATTPTELYEVSQKYLKQIQSDPKFWEDWICNKCDEEFVL